MINKNPTLEIYHILRQKILEYKLEPGSKFNQEDVARELGVSRTPVVKALHRLATEGLVDNIPQRGFFVHQLTIKELLELFTLREALESIVINSIANKITPQNIALLKNIMSPFSGKWTPDVIKNYQKVDKEFHKTILEICKNDLVCRVNEIFQVYDRTFIAGFILKPSDSLADHWALIDALERNDIQKAREIAEKHIAKGRTALQSSVDKLNKLGVNPEDLPVKALFDNAFIETDVPTTYS